MENLPVQYYPLANDNSTTLLTVSHDTNLSSSWTFNLLAGVLNYVHSALNVNGSRLASDASKFNLSQIAMESGILTQVINFQYNLSDEGFYVHSFYLSDPYYLYRVHKSRRCEDYYDYADIYLRLYRISFVTFPFVLTTYSE